MSYSPFHSELIDFLQRETDKRIEEEGFCLDRDAELQTFQGMLHEARSEKFSLPEILEQYHYLFQARGPIHIEQRLLDTFSKREFAALGIEKDYPKIYRALPRLYRPDQPAQSRIKPNFTHLPTLIRLMIEKAVFQLYKMPQEGSIVLFTWVINDGWGDYFAAEELKELLNRNYRVEWVVLVTKDHPLPKDCSAHVIRSGAKFPFKKEILEVFSSADLILQFPTYFPQTPELIKKIGHLRFHSIGEYGFIESSWFHPRSGNRSMGLHFLEKGILLPRLVRRDLENKSLRKWIFPKGRFYLAYLSTVAGGFVYLHALLKSLEHDERDIDLCIPDLNWLIQLLEDQGALLKLPFGIRNIEVYFGKKTYFLPLGKEGKRMRIFSPEHISHEDFQVLLSLSEDFVAVRGNQSFSEAISANKAFFYDGREHARYFFKDLLALAENRLKKYPKTLICLRGMAKAFLHNLPPEEGEWVDEIYFQEKEPLLDIALEMGGALKDPETFIGFQTFNEILKEEHAFEDFLDPFIRRELCHARHPKLAEWEAKHVEHFTTGACSLAELMASLEKVL